MTLSHSLHHKIAMKWGHNQGRDFFKQVNKEVNYTHRKKHRKFTLCHMQLGCPFAHACMRVKAFFKEAHCSTSVIKLVFGVFAQETCRVWGHVLKNRAKRSWDSGGLNEPRCLVVRGHFCIISWQDQKERFVCLLFFPASGLESKTQVELHVTASRQKVIQLPNCVLPFIPFQSPFTAHWKKRHV